MNGLGNLDESLRRVALIGVLLLALGVSAIGCQALPRQVRPAAARAADMESPPSAATTFTPPATPLATLSPTEPSPPVPSPNATPQPRPTAAPEPSPRAEATAAPGQELDEASRLMPIPTGAIPRGPRKPPPNRILIPSVGIDAKVISLGTHVNENGELVWDTAPFAVGHHNGTANPGEVGNVVMSGHISSRSEGAVFKSLPEVKVGDGVVVVTKERDFLYQIVDRQIVEPGQIEILNTDGGEMLTLITCFPDRVYTHRLVLKARRI